MNPVILGLLCLSLWLPIAYGDLNPTEIQLQQFIDQHVAQLEPLTTKANQAYWDASVSGREEDYDRYNQYVLQIRQLHQDPKTFALLKEWRASNAIRDELLRRQLELLYLAYLRDRIEPELLKKMVELDTRIQKNYNTFRGEIEGKKVTNSEIYKILTTEKNSSVREKAWLASKQVGERIASDLIQLVHLRNQAARNLGFENYHTFFIEAGEQHVEDLDRLFQTLDELTQKPFAEMKNELDSILASQYGIETSALMPWHYHDPFFQRTPLVYELNLDQYYQKANVEQLAKQFYAGIGLPVDEILSHSDLYDREGKYPHAFSTDIDRRGDVRILCNLNNDERWMETILHELGHAIYDKNHNATLPYVLREPAHSFTTEAIAMLFGRLSRNAAWMKEMLHLSEDQYREIAQVASKYLRFQQVLFIRWALVMYQFEKQLYADPDQNLNEVWWDLVKRYQYLNPPPPPHRADWAAKFHFTIAPCYYHNYVLGELLASQIHATLTKKFYESGANQDISYIGNPAIGQFLREMIFAPCSCYSWNAMIERATGEPLNPNYFIEQFIQ